jgi:NAD(P)H dehydrogenase (quinone)
MANRKIYLILFLFFIITNLSAQKAHTILITYHSKSGKTASMAKAIAKGAAINDTIAIIVKTIEQTTKDDLLYADAIILGSPVYNANPSSDVLKFIESWPFAGTPLKNKIGAAFVTGGGISSGEELVQVSILHAMLVFGMVVVGGDDWTAPFGAAAITNEAPFDTQMNDAFLLKGQNLGKRVANTVLRWQKK